LLIRSRRSKPTNRPVLRRRSGGRGGGDAGWQVKFADIDNDQRAEVISTLGGDVRAWRNNKGLTPDTYAGSPVTIATGFNGADTSFAEIVP
jgi:hypothetical protein